MSKNKYDENELEAANMASFGKYGYAYESMWKELKESITDDLNYHKSGVMQSMAESVQGENKCRELLKAMNDIEKKYKVNNIKEN